MKSAWCAAMSSLVTGLQHGGNWQDNGQESYVQAGARGAGAGGRQGRATRREQRTRTPLRALAAAAQTHVRFALLLCFMSSLRLGCLAPGGLCGWVSGSATAAAAATAADADLRTAAPFLPAAALPPLLPRAGPCALVCVCVRVCACVCVCGWGHACAQRINTHTVHAPAAVWRAHMPVTCPRPTPASERCHGAHRARHNLEHHVGHAGTCTQQHRCRRKREERHTVLVAAVAADGSPNAHRTSIVPADMLEASASAMALGARFARAAGAGLS
jgi:hypothetical protein